MRVAFRELGPAYAKLPHLAAKTLHGKEPVHLATTIIWYVDTVRRLDRWGGPRSRGLALSRGRRHTGAATALPLIYLPWRD